MENYEQMTVPILRNLARERGLRGYSRLRRAELIQRLRATRAQILDQAIDTKMANVPFLTPTPYTPPQATPAPNPTPSSKTVEDLINYLENVREIPRSVSPRIKKLQEDIKNIYNRMKLFEVRESNSTLREFARVYTIGGIEGYDARTLLLYSRENISRLLRNNRRTKVKLILKCTMETGIIPEEIEIKLAYFHSDVVVNLHGTDEDDLYVMMTEIILEKLAKYQKKKVVDGGYVVLLY